MGVKYLPKSIAFGWVKVGESEDVICKIFWLGDQTSVYVSVHNFSSKSQNQVPFVASETRLRGLSNGIKFTF